MGEGVSDNARRPKGSAHTESAKVLCVDDDDALVAGMGRALRRHFTVTATTSVDDALEFLRREPNIAAVVSDLEMPDMDGVSLLATAREVSPDTVRVLLSGKLSVAATADAINRCGIFRCLVKPVSPDELVSALHDAVAQYADNLANRLATHMAQIEQALLMASDPILVVDESGSTRFQNEAAAQFFGVDSARVGDHDLGIQLAADNEEQLVNSVSGRTAQLRSTTIEWHGTSCRMLILRDVTEQLRVNREIGEAKKKLEEANLALYSTSITDPLTGLLNRRGFETKLWEEISRCRRYGANPTAILIDCDKFKDINTNFGHASGDKALKYIADRIAARIRQTDVAARIGGDEFLVLLPETRQAEGIIVAEKIREGVSATEVVTPNGSFPVSVSAGVAGLSPAISSVEDILQLAQEALSFSKASGRDCVVSSEQVTQAVPAVDRIFEPGFLSVYVQPIVEFATSAALGYHCSYSEGSSDDGSPEPLVSIAREAGMLTAFDLHQLEVVLAKVGGLRPRHFHYSLFPGTLMDGKGPRILELMSAHPNATFCIELSDQEFVGDVTEIRDSLLALRNKGVYLALSHVGYGGRTLEALLCLEPDFIRVSKASLGLFDEAHIRRRSWIRMLQVANAIGAKVVADGIENREDAELFEDLGIQYGQGAFFGAPVRKD